MGKGSRDRVKNKKQFDKNYDKVFKKKCSTCYGYGLWWSWGDPSPMGPMDVKDGIPTLPCPKCGANANPI